MVIAAVGKSLVHASAVNGKNAINSLRVTLATEQLEKIVMSKKGTDAEKLITLQNIINHVKDLNIKLPELISSKMKSKNFDLFFQNKSAEDIFVSEKAIKVNVLAEKKLIEGMEIRVQASALDTKKKYFQPTDFPSLDLRMFEQITNFSIDKAVSRVVNSILLKSLAKGEKAAMKVA